MTRGFSRDSSGVKILFSILAFAVLVGVLVVPISAVTSYAYENSDVPDEATVISTTDDTIVTPEFPVGSVDLYPTWVVKTYVGAYSTASNPGVYAYITSPNNPKASTRTAVEEYLGNAFYLTTRLFVFKDFDATDPINQRSIYVTADVLDSPYNPYALFYSPHSWTTFYFSNDNIVYYTLTLVNITDGTTLRRGGSYSYVAPPNPEQSRAGISVSTIYSDFSSEWGDRLNLADYVVTNVQVEINPVFFDTQYPTTSWCEVEVKKPSFDQVNDYTVRKAKFLMNYSALQDEIYELGYTAGKGDGYLDGYDVGYRYGYNVGETSNFEPGWFIEGVDAFLDIRLFEYEALGSTHDFTLGTIFMLAVGGTALLWFLKLFAGG